MAKYTIYRDDRWDSISANTLEELRDLRSEGNRKYISHGYGSVAEYYDKRSEEYRYIDIYSEEECSHDGKYVYEEWSMCFHYIQHDDLYEGKLNCNEKVIPRPIKTNMPYPPYIVYAVNKIWRDTIKRKLNELKSNN